MKIVIVYIYPECGGNGHAEKAVRFLDSYHRNPPGADHHTAIICNGCAVNGETEFMFGSLPNVQFLNHDDSGYDIGGYQLAAKTIPCDLMVFFGGATYFRGAGWLNRMISAYNTYGQNLYGCTGNQGDYRVNVFPHVRTTAFWCNPQLINDHPLRVTHNGLRYEYEHGRTGLTTWVLNQGRQAWIIGWTDARRVDDCDNMPGGFHRGMQENILVGDRLTAPPYYQHP